MAVGSVVVNPDGSVTTTPGMSVTLFNKKIARTALPDTTNPPTCTLTALAAQGVMLLTVDQTLGFVVGSQVSIFPMSAHVTAKTPTSLTLDTALPKQVAAGVVVGFQGTLAEWQAIALASLVAVKRGVANDAMAQAEALVEYLPANVVVGVTVAAGALQTLPAPPIAGADTAAPTVPRVLTGVIT